MRWMEACIFKCHLSILVKGNHTKYFEVERGLRQRDPLSPFLFVIITKCLSCLIKKAITMGDFKGVRVDEDTLVEIIQFIDDTLIIGEGGCKNLWSIKAILRGFNLVSGLWVNFHKSRLIGINVSSHFFAASNFLSCKVENSSFSFLGIHIGCNPRRIKIWYLIVDKFKSKLTIWRGIFLSLASRITLINSIMSSLPIFLFYFYKAPISILKDIDKIRKLFLWGGSEDKSKFIG